MRTIAEFELYYNLVLATPSVLVHDTRAMLAMLHNAISLFEINQSDKIAKYIDELTEDIAIVLRGISKKKTKSKQREFNQIVEHYIYIA